MININFSNKFTKWQNKVFDNIEICFAGYLHIENDTYDGNEALEYVNRMIKSYDTKNNYLYEKLFNRLNGSWSIIIKYEDKVLLVSDIIRSIPIYYSIKDNIIYISDNTNILVDILNIKDYIQDNIDTYIEKLSAPQGQTIIKNLYDVEAGHFIIFDGKALNNIKYWYMPTKLNNINGDYLLKKSNDIFDLVFLRMKNYFDKNIDLPIFLPLSGGMDSRLLAWAIKKYNIKNRVISFTYGRDENVEEAQISKQLAQQLDFEWEFIKYSKDKWREIRKEFSVLINDFSTHKAVIHLQDYISIKYLKEKYGNAIVLPGLCFDVFAGLTIPNELKFNNHINKNNHLMTRNIYNDRLNNYEDIIKNTRLSSFIVNSLRTYEYFGLKYYLPYWDIDLTNYWYSVPIKYRIERNLFRQYLNEYAYIDEFKVLLDIPIALGRRIDDKFIELNNIDKIKIIVKYYLRKISIVDIIKSTQKEKRKKGNLKSDYVGFYDFFEDGDFNFGIYERNYHQLIGKFMIMGIKSK